MYKTLKNNVLQLLEKDTRLDGRKPIEYRKPMELEYGISKTAEGSARVQIGETIVLAGVKLGVEEPYPDTPEEGKIMVNAELVPLSSSEYEPGPPREKATELARVIDRGIREAKAIDVNDLCIKKGEKVWSVSIDLVPINDAGNLFDAMGLAALAALQDTKLPEYKDGELDYKKKTDKGLPLNKEPLPVTVSKIGEDYIVDPNRDEENVIDARLTVTAIKDGTLSALQKGGEVPLTIEEIDKMVEIGLEQSKKLRKKLKKSS